MELKLPSGMNLNLAKYRDKAKLIVATACALTATVSAVMTFATGSGAFEDSDAANLNWNGPVGLLDGDYQHLVTVGKITRARRADEYVAVEARDPMVAPKGALKSKAPLKTEGPEEPPPPTTLPSMWLSGIIWDPENPIVIIDGLDLRVGDRVKGARVVEIRIDSVVLSYASKEYVLTVE